MPVVTIGGKKVFVVPSTIPHEPIYIVGNSAFTKENGVVSGTGTATDPFIIENWDISASGSVGIEIRKTSDFFIIRNCSIHGGKVKKHSGIWLTVVKNGRIDNVTSYYNYHGVRLNDSSNNIITNCNLYNNLNNGIHIYESPDTKIHYNNIYGNGTYGILNVESEKEYEMDATNNWWGSPDGPGKKVLGKVIVEPWLKDKRGN